MWLFKPSWLGVLLSLGGCVVLPYPTDVEIEEKSLRMDLTPGHFLDLTLRKPSSDGFNADLVECVSEKLSHTRDDVHVLAGAEFWQLTIGEEESLISAAELLTKNALREQLDGLGVKFVIGVRGRTWEGRKGGFGHVSAGVVGEWNDWHTVSEAIVLETDTSQVIEIIQAEAVGKAAAAVAVVYGVAIVPLTESSACRGLGKAVSDHLPVIAEDAHDRVAVLPTSGMPFDACTIPVALALDLDEDAAIAQFQTCGGLGWEGLKWACIAANHRHAEAQYRMGYFYGAGLGLNRDLVRAYAWYTLAEVGGFEYEGSRYMQAAAGWKCCFTEKEIIADEMTSAQIAEAERLVAEWEPNPAECEALAAEQ